jgi:hypothetical protein
MVAILARHIAFEGNPRLLLPKVGNSNQLRDQWLGIVGSDIGERSSCCGASGGARLTCLRKIPAPALHFQARDLFGRLPLLVSFTLFGVRALMVMSENFLQQ